MTGSTTADVVNRLRPKLMEVGGMQVFSFLAIPFFVFAGELMLYGGIADRIVRWTGARGPVPALPATA